MTAGRKVVSQSVHWGTPSYYVQAVKRVFDDAIALDPCSNEWSVVKAEEEWALPDVDGLSKEWAYETIYVNPPYGADRERKTNIQNWLKKCADSHKKYGSEVLALVPVAVNTKHWKHYVWGHATAVCFLYDTRLKFLENGMVGGKGAPMACAMVYWGQSYNKFFEIFMEFGAVVDIRNLQGEIIGSKDRGLFPKENGTRENFITESVTAGEEASL